KFCTRDDRLSGNPFTADYRRHERALDINSKKNLPNVGARFSRLDNDRGIIFERARTSRGNHSALVWRVASVRRSSKNRRCRIGVFRYSPPGRGETIGPGAEGGAPGV